jgi:polyisoprenoid-binding protein YceI
MIRRYLLDPGKSKFTVQAFATGMLASFAHNPRFLIREFDGEIQLDSDLASPAGFAMSVKSASLDLIDKVKPDDRGQIQLALMDQVLQAKRYPEISFRSTEVAATRISQDWFRAQIRGEMHLCGVARPVSIDSQLRLAPSEARLGGEFPLLLSDYQIKQISAVGGLIKVKDELKFVFDLLGHQQE